MRTELNQLEARHMMSKPGAAPFEASVAIWKGVKPVANSGWLAMGGGHFSLFDGKGRALVQVPTDEVWATKSRFTMGSGVSLRIRGDHYMISPGSGQRPAGLAEVMTASSIAGSSVLLALGRMFAGEFYAALETAGGHLGKGPST